jgi:hypothetical protein
LCGACEVTLLGDSDEMLELTEFDPLNLSLSTIGRSLKPIDLPDQ